MQDSRELRQKCLQKSYKDTLMKVFKQVNGVKKINWIFLLGNQKQWWEIKNVSGWQIQN